jgi:O-antigen/teichoic acid export membrane protein
VSRQSVNALIFVGARVLSLVIPLITIPVLGRSLGPHGMGLLAFSQALAQFLAISTELGFNANSITTVTRVRGDRDQLRVLFWSLMGMRMAAFAAGFLALLLLIGLLAADKNEALVMLLGALMMLGFALTPGWLYQGVEKIAQFSFLLLSPKLLTLPLIVLFVKSPSDVFWAGGLVMGAEMMSGLVLFVYAAKIIVPGGIEFDRGMARREFSQAVQPWIGNIIDAAVVAINIIVLKNMVGLYVAGIFSASDRLVRVAFSLFHPVVGALQAHISRLWVSDPEAAHRQSLRVGGILVAGAIVFALICQWHGDELISIVFGEVFRSAGDLLRIESIWLVFAVAGYVLMYFYFISRGASNEVKLAYRYSAIFHLVCLPVAINFWNAVGAVVTVVLTQGVFLVFLLWQAKLSGRVM